jgi:hypothetical protein
MNKVSKKLRKVVRIDDANSQETDKRETKTRTKTRGQVLNCESNSSQQRQGVRS